MSERDSGDTNILLEAVVKAGQAWKEGLGKIEQQNKQLRKEISSLKERMAAVETLLGVIKRIGYAVLVAIILAVVGKLMELL